MKGKSEDIIDDIIRESVEDEFHSSPAPFLSKDEAWNRMLIRKENKPPVKKRGKIKPALTAAAILFLLFTALLMAPQTSKANLLISQLYEKIQGSTLQIFTVFKDTENQESVPDEPMFTEVPGLEIYSEKVSLEEARELTDFAIKLPSYIPSGYTLDHVLVVRHNEELSRDIYLKYTSGDKNLSIRERQLTESFAAGKVTDAEDVTSKEVTVYENEATLLTYKNRLREVIWVDRNFYYIVRGDLEEEEILEVSQSLYK